MMKFVGMGAVLATVAITSGPAVAASKKEKECGYQADIVAAVQKARIDRVKERDVPEIVMAGEVTWPERYNDTIAIFAGEIYKLKVRELKKTDQTELWRELCLAN